MPVLGLKIYEETARGTNSGAASLFPIYSLRKEFENKSRTVNSVLPEEHDPYNLTFTTFLPHNTSFLLSCYMFLAYNHITFCSLISHFFHTFTTFCSHSHITFSPSHSPHFYPSRTAVTIALNPNTSFYPFYQTTRHFFSLCYISCFLSHHILRTQRNIFSAKNSSQHCIRPTHLFFSFLSNNTRLFFSLTYILLTLTPDFEHTS